MKAALHRCVQATRVRIRSRAKASASLSISARSSGLPFYNICVDWDVIIAGAGIIGISLALELRERGARVVVLDRGDPGREASSAAAGMLAAGDPETPAALRPLALESARMFPEYVRKLESVSGISTDFRRDGAIVLGKTYGFGQKEKSSNELSPAGPSPGQLSSGDLRRLEPTLEAHGHAALLVEEDSVDPRLLMRAALAAAQRQGVEVRGHTGVTELRARRNAPGNTVEVITSAGVLTAAAAVNCRGAWSGAPVRPRKGQMLYLQPAEKNLLRHVVLAPEVYIVPRSSGKILVGATVEDVGFDTTVERAAIERLRAAATRYLPALNAAVVAESWAGLRPGTPDDLPLLGATGVPGIFVASGHFRNGILLAPVTARLMAEVIAGKAPSLDVGAFAAARFE